MSQRLKRLHRSVRQRQKPQEERGREIEGWKLSQSPKTKPEMAQTKTPGNAQKESGLPLKHFCKRTRVASEEMGQSVHHVNPTVAWFLFVKLFSFDKTHAQTEPLEQPKVT